jgi:hypothetical protein
MIENIETYVPMILCGKKNQVQRRNFIRLSGASLGSLLISSFIKAEGKKIHSIKLPDSI